VKNLTGLDLNTLMQAFALKAAGVEAVAGDGAKTAAAKAAGALSAD